MSDRERQEAMLDAVFDTARRQEIAPSDDLMARVLADAAAEQPVPGRRPVARQSVFARLLENLGGWPAVSGLAAAGFAGLWVGLVPPAGIEDLAASAIGATETVPLTGFDWSFGTEASDG